MGNDLYTPQGERLTGAPWQAYPRPQCRRESYVNLNGEWDFGVTENGAFPKTFDRKIQVPFCPESLLSGIHTHFDEGSTLFYRRKFTLEPTFNKGRALLHLEGIDQKATVYVNQKEIGTATGVYGRFTFDITEALEEENTLVIAVTDDLRSTVLPYGKQTMNRGGMWYTPVSGIWQTVWMESVPCHYIEKLDMDVTDTKAVITITPALDGQVQVEGKVFPIRNGKGEISPENLKLWSPESPYLYNMVIETEEDRVESYFALRSLEIKPVNGLPRLCLNGKPYFFHGLLDQGYWPDGIYTPAAPECYEADILAMKKLGFNTLRKHIKVEPEQFYYDCDRLGMVVFQDMVNNGDYQFFRDTALPTVGIQKLRDQYLHKDRETRAAFLRGMEETVERLRNHPSIVYWTIFNEGWGQFCSTDAYRRLKELDSSRFIDSTSGWFRCGETDVESLHIYFGSWNKLKACDKPLVLSEFGGYCYAEEGHLFNPHKAYGYKTCQTAEEFKTALEQLYREKVLPAIPRGLCAAIYTQVSDVEDEINGLLTYDRKICKVEEAPMQGLAEALQAAIHQAV